MKKSMIALCAGSLILMAGICQATSEHTMTPYTGSAEFERLKGLSGTWEGTHIMNGLEEKAVVEYEVTANAALSSRNSFPARLTRWFPFIMMTKGN